MRESPPLRVERTPLTPPIPYPNLPFPCRPRRYRTCMPLEVPPNFTSSSERPEHFTPLSRSAEQQVNAYTSDFARARIYTQWAADLLQYQRQHSRAYQQLREIHCAVAPASGLILPPNIRTATSPTGWFVPWNQQNSYGAQRQWSQSGRVYGAYEEVCRQGEHPAARGERYEYQPSPEGQDYRDRSPRRVTSASGPWSRPCQPRPYQPQQWYEGQFTSRRSNGPDAHPNQSVNNATCVTGGQELQCPAVSGGTQ